MLFIDALEKREKHEKNTKIIHYLNLRDKYYENIGIFSSSYFSVRLYKQIFLIGYFISIFCFSILLKLYLGHFPRSFISLKEMWYEISGKNGRETYAHKTLLAISQYILWVTSPMERQKNKYKNQPANISMKTKIEGDFSYIKNICCISKYL